MKAKPWYLAGPMTGIPYYNLPAFDKAARDLRANGYDVISPAELDNPETVKACLEDEEGKVLNAQWEEFLLRDLDVLLRQCGGIVMLPGWETSRGACLELSAAMLAKKHLRRLAEPDKIVILDPTVAGQVIALTSKRAQGLIE